MTKEHLSIRLGEEADQKYLVEWLLQPGVLDGFPLYGLREVEDAARICVSYAQHGAMLMALWDGVPCGCALLYLQHYEKMKHHCLFVIIVDEKHRGKGVGARLIRELMKLAKERFNLEYLHLEVYKGNPAIDLYRRLGFQEYGVHKKFIKDQGRYIDKILMQKYLR
ncbi:MAG: GNAT family N-acetyltransferase [Verrucomicrobiota bacterium]|nr:GNAT family N-acetyltransferase [Verrucomicrobiota bacterium]